MGAPVGNKNSKADNRLWANTIRRAIAQSDPERLRRIAEKLLDKAEEGDLQAMKELGDRLDGKSSQDISVSGAVSHEHVAVSATARWIEEALRGGEERPPSEPVSH